MFDFAEIARRVFKYLIEGFIVAIVAFAIPKQSLDMGEIMIIGLSAVATFSLLDTWIPAMAVSARSGAGLGIGMGLVGFPAGF